MRLTVAAVGRLRGGPESELIDDYAVRIRGVGRGVGVTAFDIREVESPKALSPEKRQERESSLLMEAAAQALCIAMDEHGDVVTSAEFAARIGRWRDRGVGEVAFLIGGADGHHSLLQAQGKIAFGRATFPHMLVRVMLAEQIYRAVTILSGHPYHRS